MGKIKGHVQGKETLSMQINKVNEIISHNINIVNGDYMPF